MQQIATVWGNMDNRRRAIVGLATAAVLVAFFTMARLATAPSMTLLYAGLENGAAGDVVRALEQRGAVYEVRGGSIFVDSPQRDELRMTLASEGLPANGARGYELLDTLNGFGTTSQMFDAAYWRAKEGELARTIVANPQISQARVHIANASSSPFARSAKPTASIAITTTGGPLNASQAKAFQFLVASAVAGLSVEDVTVIDSNGTILSTTEDPSLTPQGTDLAAQLRERVERIIGARVGSGNAVVEVSVETVTETESIRERRFDPDSRIAISTDTEERSNTSTQAADGVTVASNLPDGDASQSEGSSAETSETRERVNYEVSATEREVVRAPGAIRRLSVAVLVNGLVEADENGDPLYRNRSDEELQTLRDLVSSAVGFDEARGDTITIRSMELPSVQPEGTTAETSLLSGVHLDAMSLIQMAVLAIVTLVLALFVIRPLLSRPAELNSETPRALPAAPTGFAEPTPALTGEVADFDPTPSLSVRGDTNWDRIGANGSDPVDRLRNMIGERQDETVEILRNWLEDKEETA